MQTQHYLQRRWQLGVTHAVLVMQQSPSGGPSAACGLYILASELWPQGPAVFPTYKQRVIWTLCEEPASAVTPTVGDLT